jgi:hypothetical protein
LSTYKNWLHRLHKLPLNGINKAKELNTIINIAENNGYNRQQILRIYHSIERKNHKNNDDVQQKWVSFTSTGNYIRTITKLLKNTNIKIAFKTNNTIGNILKDRIINSTYEQTGIYKLIFAKCKQAYIGQTGRALKVRYKEHIRSIKYNKEDSAYATHMLNNAHYYGKMEDVRKGRLMNIKENFHIYMHKQQNKSSYDIALTFIHTPNQPP